MLSIGEFPRVESIGLLKSLGFSINEIKRIFDNCQTDEDLNDFIKNKMIDVERQIKELQSRKKKLGLYHSMTRMNHVDYSDIKERNSRIYSNSAVRQSEEKAVPFIMIWNTKRMKYLTELIILIE